MKKTGQKERTFRASATPRKVTAQVSFGFPEPESRGTRKAIANAMTIVRTATARNDALQPKAEAEAASGAVAASVPILARPICRLVRLAKRSGGNRRA